ncbi:hypothetical protein [Rhizobium leguminosarum]|uniref:hypothetical protein n=1 Tax=Rhizobium leguminosarum TaxID=384 RepID=UPI001C96D8D0|nr:hypothetical protein [Rhizobium leguminosarum]MBY5400678.1 hypothetical protein [Rhizobium leguminosarum]
MRSVILVVALSLPLPVFGAGVMNVKASEHSCSELAQIIRQNKKVFVRMGFGGRSFRYPPAQCSMGDKRTTTSLRDGEGKQCILDYSCVFDPASPYNFP